MENNERQEAMAFLRERFLFLISTLNNKTDCEIRMYENTTVRAQIKAFDVNFENIIVENLQTPLPKSIDKAIIRTSDIISMHFKFDLNKLVGR